MKLSNFTRVFLSVVDELTTSIQNRVESREILTLMRGAIIEYLQEFTDTPESDRENHAAEIVNSLDLSMLNESNVAAWVADALSIPQDMIDMMHEEVEANKSSGEKSDQAIDDELNENEDESPDEDGDESPDEDGDESPDEDLQGNSDIEAFVAEPLLELNAENQKKSEIGQLVKMDTIQPVATGVVDISETPGDNLSPNDKDEEEVIGEITDAVVGESDFIISSLTTVIEGLFEKAISEINEKLDLIVTATTVSAKSGKKNATRDEQFDALNRVSLSDTQRHSIQPVADSKQVERMLAMMEMKGN